MEETMTRDEAAWLESHRKLLASIRQFRRIRDEWMDCENKDEMPLTPALYRHWYESAPITISHRAMRLAPWKQRAHEALKRFWRAFKGGR